MKKQALITGATSGIGRATALRLAAEGYDIIATGRRSERLESLRREIEAAGGRCTTLTFDVRSEEAVRRNLEPLGRVDLLVNNAGLALGINPAQGCDLDQWETMVDTNIKGLMYTTRMLLPRLIAHGAGASIVNVGSVAGNWPYPGGNVYGGTKAFVRQFSLGLRCDLAGTGVRVTDLEPGLCESEFTLVRFGGDQARYDATYAGAKPVQPEDIAETIFWLMNQPAHLNINNLEIMPVSQTWAGFAIHRE